MNYTSQNLIFEPNEIYFIDNKGRKLEVMMDWEDELMSGSASYVTENGGDILEIGFGMGISAGYIQSHSISSHTIIENHPEVIPLALNWAADKPNVTIITGSWYDNLDNLSTYDGVFYDTYGDEKCHEFSSKLPSIVKPGAKVTWWNLLYNSESVFHLDDIQYQEFNISPPENSYFNNSKYYLPKKQF
jgi:type IV protein arginine methyltransferase